MLYGDHFYLDINALLYFTWLHFQIRNEGQLAGTRSPLYRKLWCWATAHFFQNGTRYNEKQRENTESTKKTLFRQTQNRHAAPCLHTFSRISIDIRKTKEKRKLSNFKFSTHTSSPIELKIGILTLHPPDNKRSKAGRTNPRFRKVMIETNLLCFLIWKWVKIFAFFSRLVLACIEVFFDSFFTFR